MSSTFLGWAYFSGWKTILEWSFKFLFITLTEAVTTQGWWLAIKRYSNSNTCDILLELVSEKFRNSVEWKPNWAHHPSAHLRNVSVEDKDDKGCFKAGFCGIIQVSSLLHVLAKQTWYKYIHTCMYYISILWCIPLVGSRQIFHHQTQYFSNEHVCLVQVLLSNAFKPILMKNKIK